MVKIIKITSFLPIKLKKYVTYFQTAAYWSSLYLLLTTAFSVFKPVYLPNIFIDLGGKVS